jgi:hypothetical protein
MPDRAKIVKQGRIWANQATREVLWQIMKTKVENGVLLITDDTKEIEGRIGISGSTTITGAHMKKSPELGWNALQILLRFQQGTFQYFDYGAHGLGDLDQGLKIRLTQIINVLPDLPMRIDQLAGPNTLNRIRAIDPAQLAEMKKVEETKKKVEESKRKDEEVHGIDQNVMQQIREFESKTMRYRAAAMWGTFVAIALGAGAIVYFHR